ncbi:acidic leucine-rich nuclear phosphoprotein 32 family member A isoform X1 [Uranotaenia lowii]|uniref:acidic leucine-rich nuclear phosphoprotein 32 family member A isoform X1 n=1 Tax=Uranotaenia lowii TaxID=190385 RepID=UPI00247AFD96|nr:acidic leucine-rich nuclear phosphoprotein 32 family member A isoform X1 [Uranotaenia lowii]
MEKRIALEKRGLPDDQTRELILDNCRSTHIEGLTDSFTALEILSLINVGLVSLKSFPKLPALRKLELSDNRILNGLNHLVDSPQLTHLNLSGNRIKDFEELTPLKELKNLEVLDLFNNEVTSTDNYRDKIFALIPSLKYLDGFDKDDTEAPSDEDEDANGYDDDEENGRFSINGIEIDLDELEQFESKLKEKRKPANGLPSTTAVDQQQHAINGLEDRLGQLELQTADDSTEHASSSKTVVTNDNDKDDLDLMYEEIQRRNEERTQRPAPSLGSLLLSFLSLLAFLNQICFVQPRSEQLLIENSDNLLDEEETGLSEVYNDDLVDDDEDWDDEEDEEDYADDPTDDEEDDGEEAEEGAVEVTSDGDGEVKDAEAARGTKRKHDGNDG